MRSMLSLFDIVMMGRALAGMTSDLGAHPEEISQGTFKTFGNAVITLANLYKRIGSAPEEHELPGLAVIALPNSQAGSLIAEAFIQVTFPAVSFSDPARTVDFLKENRANILVSPSSGRRRPAPTCSFDARDSRAWTACAASI